MTDRKWVPTAGVRAGDQLAHKLSDTPWTYTTVTGWSDRVLPGCGAGGTDVTHRTFTVTDAPWWVRTDNFALVHDLAGTALIKRRDDEPASEEPASEEPASEEPASEEPASEEPVTRVVLTDDLYGYRMPVPSAFTSDFMASDDSKWAVLGTIGIARRDGVSPLGAWRDAVADECGIPRAALDPAQGGRFDLGFTPAYVRKFVFYLA